MQVLTHFWERTTEKPFVIHIYDHVCTSDFPCVDQYLLNFVKLKRVTVGWTYVYIARLFHEYKPDYAKQMCCLGEIFREALIPESTCSQLF